MFMEGDLGQESDRGLILITQVVCLLNIIIIKRLMEEIKSSSAFFDLIV